LNPSGVTTISHSFHAVTYLFFDSDMQDKHTVMPDFRRHFTKELNTSDFQKQKTRRK